MVGREVAVDPVLRRQVMASMATVLMRIFQRDLPVTEEMKLMDELGLSSSLGLELLLELEEELSIQIDVEELDQEEMSTVGDLADYIAGHSIPQ
jgi:acyl carrier protein